MPHSACHTEDAPLPRFVSQRSWCATSVSQMWLAELARTCERSALCSATNSTTSPNYTRLPEAPRGTQNGTSCPRRRNSKAGLW